MACVMTNKYAEGYPGKRYYGGCEWVDVAETLAIERLKKIFGAEHANVQPHAGAQANMAVFMAVLQPGDTVLGMSLAHGGHLTHGTKVSFFRQAVQRRRVRGRSEGYGAGSTSTRSASWPASTSRSSSSPPGRARTPGSCSTSRYREIADEVGAPLLVDFAHVAGLVATGLHPSPVPLSDFVTSTTHKTMRGPRGGFVLSTTKWAQPLDKSVFPGIQGGPLMHMIAAKAVAFHEAQQPEFATYQRQVVENARVMAEEFSRAGLRLVAGGTDTHLMLVDVSVKGLTGKAVEEYLDQVGITVNKNAIPFDTQKPFVASGIRLGTPAITARGFGADESREVAGSPATDWRISKRAPRSTSSRPASTNQPADTTFPRRSAFCASSSRMRSPDASRVNADPPAWTSSARRSSSSTSRCSPVR